MEEETMEMETELRDPRVYEIGYLLLPHMTQDDAVEAVSEIKSALSGMSAEHISEGEPQSIDLAYTMMKVIDNKNSFFDTGYFGWIKFAINPEAVAGVEKMLDEHEALLRHLLIKTVREDTMVNAKPMAAATEIATPDSHKATTPDEAVESEEDEEVDEEELDDKLEELTSDEE